MNKLFKFRKCAPKGQSPYSPGHRPGKVGCVANALKGQKLPFQGEITYTLVPRAMPWAAGFLAFQAVPTQMVHYLRNHE